MSTQNFIFIAMPTTDQPTEAEMKNAALAALAALADKLDSEIADLNKKRSEIIKASNEILKEGM